MSTKFNFELTEVGQNGLWRAQNNGIDFELTHIQFGSSGEQKDSQYDAVKLSQPEQYSPIASGNRISETQIRIYAKVVPTHAFEIREIGLWQGEPNKEGSILFAYIAQDALFGQMVEGIDLIFSYDMIFTTADINSITIIEDSDTSLVLSLIGQHETNYDAHPYYVHKEKDNLIKGSNTFEKPIVGDLQGNADTTTKLKTARNISITGAIKANPVQFDGSKDIALNVESVNIGSIEGDVNAKTAETLKTARTIAISGAVTGTATSFDGSKNITIPTTQVDGSKVTGTVDRASLATFADNADNAKTADKLSKTIDIHGVEFDGTQSINIPIFNTQKSGVVPARVGNTTNKYLCEDGVWKVVDVSSVPNAKTADQLTTARTIALHGAVTGTATSFNGSANISIPTTSVDGSKVVGAVPSATKLHTARTINGVAFDGTQNITVSLSASVGSYGSLADNTVYTNTDSGAHLVFIRIARGSTNGGSGAYSIVVYPKDLDVPSVVVAPADSGGEYTYYSATAGGYSTQTISVLVPSGYSYYIRQNGMYTARRRIVKI